MSLAGTGTVGGPSGTLTLGALPTGGLGGAGTVGAVRGVLSLSDAPSVILFDEDNNWLAALPLADGIQYSREVSDPGMVALRLPADDAATALVTKKRFVKVYHHARCQQSARVESSGYDFTVDGRAWRAFDNQAGVLDMMRDLAVWPEYGIDRTYSTDRTFGYMSITAAIDGVVTNWFSSGNWSAPVDSVRYQDDTGFRQFKPAGLSYPNPWWIAKGGPYHAEPAGSEQWFRHRFTSYDTEIDFQLLAAADNILELWLDGEQLITPDQQQGKGWIQALQVTGKLPPGDHVLAAKVRNSRRKSSPVAFIATIQQLQKNGDVVLGDPLVKTARFNWFISDVLPGFRRGDVLRRVVKENRDHDIPAASLIGMDFDVLTGSDGAEWTDDPDQHTFPVGMDGLEVVRSLAEKDMDVALDPDRFVLQAWPRKGTDLSATVQISRGQQRTGSADEQVDRIEPRFNVALIQLQDGTWIEVEDDNASTDGRAVQAVSAGSTATERGADKIARSMFTDAAHQALSFTVKLNDTDGPQFGVDFEEGDSVSLEDESGAWVKVRVMGGMVTGRDGGVDVELEVERDYST